MTKKKDVANLWADVTTNREMKVKKDTKFCETCGKKLKVKRPDYFTRWCCTNCRLNRTKNKDKSNHEGL